MASPHISHFPFLREVLVEGMEWTHVHSVGPQRCLSSQVQLHVPATWGLNILGTAWDQAVFWVLLSASWVGQWGQQCLWRVWSASFSRCLRRHTAADTSCTAAERSEQSQIVRVRCAFLLSWEESFPCQDTSMLKALIQPSIAWIEMKQWKYKGTSSLCLLDCAIPNHLPVLLLHFGQSLY